MDWNLLISGVIGLVAGGSVSWVFKLREDKAGSEADALDKYSEAMTKILANITFQQETFNAIIADQRKSIEERDRIIEENKTVIAEMKTQIQDLKLKVAENERKLQELQKTINDEFRKRSIAEQNMCTVEGCELRQPPKAKI